jgi:hypothetical protein
VEKFDLVVGVVAALMLGVCLAFVGGVVWWLVVFFTS